MKFILLDAEPGAGGLNVIEGRADKIATIILCVVVPIITIFAIVKIIKIYRNIQNNNKE